MSGPPIECKYCGSTQAADAKFCNQCGERFSKGEDERRSLTVLFCDIVGSTSYQQRLGPEDWRDVLKDFLDTTDQLVRQFGGVVKQFLGDGFLAYFGFPRAHDDDARRAVETGLEIITALSSLNARLLYRGWPELRVRIGISSGRVLVGSVRGSEELALGVIPNLANRLQSMASPNTVLIDDATHRLIEGFFHCEPVIGQTPRDFPEAALHVVRGRTTARTRLDASRNPRGLSPFVGRAPELRTLAHSWNEAVAGNRRSVLIKGEAGMGKTRLIDTFKNGLEGADHVFVCRASPYHQNRALYPIVEMLERTLGLLPEETKEQRLDKLERWLSGKSKRNAPSSSDMLDALPAIAPLFSVELPADRAGPPLGPEKQREIVFDSIAKWLDFLGAQGTALLVVEDVHWADPSTLELVGKLLGGKSSTRLMVLLTARPEFRAPWGSACLGLELERLSDAETASIVSAMAPQAPPGSFVDFVCRKAEGVPLFTEELTRTLLETGVLGTGTGPPSSVPTAPPPSEEIPSTLSSLLMARLDRLGRAKKTAQLAAAIGRDFGLKVLAEVSSVTPDELSADVDELIDTGLVQASVVSKESYSFKHALMRDAAYDLMSSNAREEAHAKIATAIERCLPDVKTNQPDLLAYHYAAAKRFSEAVGFAQEAADQAFRRSAYAEAIAHATNVSTWTEDMQEAARTDAVLRANRVLWRSLSLTKGWADRQVIEIVKRSDELLQKSESPVRIEALFSSFQYHHTASKRKEARESAEQLVRIADGLGFPPLQAAAAMVLGVSLHPEGNAVLARKQLERAIDLYDRDFHRTQPVNELDALVLSKVILGHFLWLVGDTEKAHQNVKEGIDWARELGHVPSIAMGLLMGSHVYQFAGDRAAVAKMTAEILELAEKYGLPAYQGYAAIIHAWALGDEKQAEGVLNVLKMLGCNLALSYYASLSADSMTDKGAVDQAIARIDECLALCEQNKEHYYEAELCRRRAMYALAKGAPTDEARSFLQRAAELAQRHETPRIELRALRELLRRFDSGTSKARISELLTNYPALRNDEVSHHGGSP